MKTLTNPPIPILYEDNHLLVVEKPVNIPSQQDSSRDPDMLSLLKHDLKTRYQKPGNVYLGLVHRLDRPVGGVMVFAKTSKAASRLSNLIRNHQFTKTYIAVIHGQPSSRSGTLTHFLRKDKKQNKVQLMDPNHPEAKKAVLHYDVIDFQDGFSFVNIQLETGRPHQIRVQFSAIGCPLFGDQKYGRNVNPVGQQIALWSMRIGLEHPTLKTPMRFHSLPDRNQEPWNRWPEAFYQQLMSEFY